VYSVCWASEYIDNRLHRSQNATSAQGRVVASVWTVAIKLET
jgi:hypothetical protein